MDQFHSSHLSSPEICPEDWPPSWSLRRLVACWLLTLVSGGGGYLRLYWFLVSACMIRELSFRVNFLVRCATHLLWLSLMLVFFQVIFRHTRTIGDLDEDRYLFFLGTSLTLNALVHCLFITGCAEFSESVRTGNLDFVLLKPVDEQFLLTCQRIDWAMIPEVLFSMSVAAYAGYRIGGIPSMPRIICYCILLGGGLAILYGLLVIISACSVWTVRHQELYELWFHLVQFSRYPADIYGRHVLSALLGSVLTYVLPILVAVTVPARYGAMLLESWHPVAYLLLAAVAALMISRWIFRFALRSYQSASS